MANRIKGITVEIGGDTTKLQTALKGVNGEIKNTQAQLKDMEKLLKLDPGNTELLAQKQKLLSDAVSETKEKLTTLKTAAEQANQSSGEVAQAMTEMAKAGWSTTQIIDGMSGVLDATAASGENFGSVATIVTAIKAFLTTAWNTIKTVISTVLNTIKTVFTTYLNKKRSSFKIELHSGRTAFCFHGELDTCENDLTCQCGSKMHVNNHPGIILRHLPFGGYLSQVKFNRNQYVCSKCGKTRMQFISFKAPGHRITEELYQYTDLLATGNYTNKEVAELTGLGKNTVKDIDKQRLQELYTIDGTKLIKPECKTKFLGIDEFKLHNGHKYATHIINKVLTTKSKH